VVGERICYIGGRHGQMFARIGESAALSEPDDFTNVIAGNAGEQIAADCIARRPCPE